MQKSSKHDLPCLPNCKEYVLSCSISWEETIKLDILQWVRDGSVITRSMLRAFYISYIGNPVCKYRHIYFFHIYTYALKSWDGAWKWTLKKGMMKQTCKNNGVFWFHSSQILRDDTFTWHDDDEIFHLAWDVGTLPKTPSMEFQDDGFGRGTPHIKLGWFLGAHVSFRGCNTSLVCTRLQLVGWQARFLFTPVTIIDP